MEKTMSRVCRYCGLEFDRKTVKGGYIDQCDQCTLSKPDVERYIGTHGECNKTANIIIHKKNLRNVKGYLWGNKTISMGLSSVEGEQERQAKKEEADRK
jgi:hypothetical protein